MILLNILAATPVDEHPFLDTPVGSVIVFIFVAMFFLGGVAAGVAGIRSLGKAWIDAHRWGTKRIRERRRRERVLDSLLSEEGWPNGSATLPDSLNALYSKVGNIEKDLEYAVAQQHEIHTMVTELSERVTQIPLPPK